MARSITDGVGNGETPGLGHNGPSEEEFLLHMRAIINAQAKVDIAKVGVKQARKLAKSAGIELKKLDAIVTMADWGPDEVRAHFATLNQYAIWMGLPIGTQPDFFDGVPEAAKPSVDWRARGYVAATTGKGAVGTPPEDCPPDQVQSWMAGWHDGQAKIASEMPSANGSATVQ
jgi:hypothetical protein